MKLIGLWIVTILLALTLGGCSTTKGKGGDYYGKVKCPHCGTEFDPAGR